MSSVSNVPLTATTNDKLAQGAETGAARAADRGCANCAARMDANSSTCSTTASGITPEELGATLRMSDPPCSSFKLTWLRIWEALRYGSPGAQKKWSPGSYLASRAVYNPKRQR